LSKGTTRLTKPDFSASTASIMRPVSAKSIAFALTSFNLSGQNVEWLIHNLSVYLDL